MTRGMPPAAQRPRRWPRAESGFTLVEVLVAMMVMAIMAVMAWQGVDGIVRTRDASQKKLEQTLRLSTVIAQWDRDLVSVQETAVAVVPSVLQCDGATVRMVRRMPDGLQVVAWSMQPNNDGSGSDWVRWASPVATTVGALQDNWLRSQQLQGNEIGSVHALTGLTGWQVYYFLGATWANCQSTGNLPTGVRIVLSFAPGSGLSGELTRDTSRLP